LGQYPRQDSNL